MRNRDRQHVWERAKGLCEYCEMPQALDVLPFQVDHIRAQKHRGLTTLDNLALACLPCNAAKGPNVAGIDSETGALTPLFNPRTDVWAEHFAWNGAILEGLTAVGRVTIQVLRINDANRVELRALL